MSDLAFLAVAGSEGPCAPPINATAHPRRIQRPRRRGHRTPAGAVYVGRPTLWGNPFERRPRIGHARSVIMYGAWLNGDVSPYVLHCAGFSEAERGALARWRNRIIDRIDALQGRDLECWCPLTSPWCHADTLLRRANV